MIDRTSRNRLAEKLRHLVAGQITNDQFVRESPRQSFDPTIWNVWEPAGDCLYSDDREYRLRGPDALPPEVRLWTTRAIVFLYSDFEYEWPKTPRGIWPFWGMWGLGFYFLIGMGFLFSGLAMASDRGMNMSNLSQTVIGLANVAIVVYHVATRPARIKENHEWGAAGEFDVWPFFRANDYAKALKRPTLLAGKASPRDWDWC